MISFFLEKTYKVRQVESDTILQKKLLALFIKVWSDIDLSVTNKWIWSFDSYMLMINKFKILFHTKSRDFLLMTKILIFVLVDGSTANIYIFFQCHTFDRYLLLL